MPCAIATTISMLFVIAIEVNQVMATVMAKSILNFFAYTFFGSLNMTNWW